MPEPILCYDCVPHPNGGIALCRRHAGPFLPAPAKLAIEVSGGCVQAVYAADPDTTEVVLLDYDNLKESDERLLREYIEQVERIEAEAGPNGAIKRFQEEARRHLLLEPAPPADGEAGHA